MNMEHRHLILGIVLFGAILISGCTNQGPQTQLPGISGFLYEVGDSHYFVVHEGYQSGVLTENELKNIPQAGLDRDERIDPVLAVPEMTETELENRVEEKTIIWLDEINTQIQEFNLVSCVEDCQREWNQPGIGHVPPEGGAESPNPCNDRCQEEYNHLEKSKAFFSEAQISDIIINYDRYGSPKLYLYYMVDGGGNSFYGNLFITPTSDGRYIGTQSWRTTMLDDAEKWMSESEAAQMLSTYLAERDQPVPILEGKGIYITYS
jgi:hypothetical protein